MTGNNTTTDTNGPRACQAVAEPPAPLAEPVETHGWPWGDGFPTRPDIVQFVKHHSNALVSPDAFEDVPLPEGLTPASAFNLVEFVRYTGAGMPVCGRHRSCGHEGSWYAMTPGFSTRLAHLEYRTRAKGSLQQQFDTYRLAKGFYPPRLSELECALALDGVSVPYESLRELCLGERRPTNAPERLATNVLQTLAKLESAPGVQLREDILDELFSQVDQGVDDLPWHPAVRPPTACYSICDRFSTSFIVSAFQEADPSDVAPVMLLLFCSEAMWKTAVFPRWNAVMEVVVRNLLFSHIGTPLLGHVPLALMFWRWQTGVEPATAKGPRFGEEMFSTRYGVDMTPLFSKLLGMLEEGLDELAHWVGEQRQAVERRRELIRANHTLNHRQQEFLLELVDRPTTTLDAAEYSRRHDIAASTAYADLQKLVDRGLLTVETSGKARTFRRAPGFAAVLDSGALR